MNGNNILNEGESKGEHKVEQVLKERLATGSSVDLY